MPNFPLTRISSKARLTSLYSDFSLLRTTNPEGYEANVKSWRSALEKAGREGLLGNGICTMRTEELEGRLEDKSGGMGKPLGLGVVVVRTLVLVFLLLFLVDVGHRSARERRLSTQERIKTMEREYLGRRIDTSRIAGRVDEVMERKTTAMPSPLKARRKVNKLGLGLLQPDHFSEEPSAPS